MIFTFGKLLSVLCGILAFIAIWAYLEIRLINRCRMSYMYKRPEFLNIRMNRSVREKFPDYRLIVYGEGEYAEKLKKNEFNGFPVLFIPGNAGSYRQVRSLASISMAKSNAEHESPNFNYFAADLNEELSALYGGYVDKQTEFVAACVKRIFLLYKKYSPKLGANLKITLIGHSMGGILARNALALKLIDAEFVKIIYTLASPNSISVLSVDRSIVSTYNFIETSEKTSASNKAIQVSIGGGFNDKMVRSDLIRFRGNSTLKFACVSSSLNKVWATADHLCMAWCNELIRLIVRSIFDLHVDLIGDQKTENLLAIVKHHFHGSSISKSYYHPSNNDEDCAKKIPSRGSGEETEISDIQKAPGAVNLKNSTFLALSEQNFEQIYLLNPNGQYYRVILRTNIANRCLLRVCTEINTTGASGCEKYEKYEKSIEFDATPTNPSILPDYSLVYELETGKSYYLWISKQFVQKSAEKFLTVTTVHTDEKRGPILDVSPMFKTYTEKIEKFGDTAKFIKLTGFRSVLQAFTVKLKPLNCSEATKAGSKVAIVKFFPKFDPPLSLFAIFSYPYNKSDDLILTLDTTNTLLSPNVELRLFLNPFCAYDFELAFSPLLFLSQVVRFHYEKIPFICVAIIAQRFIAKNYFASVGLFLAVISLELPICSTDSLLGNCVLYMISFGVVFSEQLMHYFIYAILLFGKRFLSIFPVSKISFFARRSNLLQQCFCVALMSSLWSASCAFVFLYICSVFVCIGEQMKKSGTNCGSYGDWLRFLDLGLWLLVLQAPNIIAAFHSFCSRRILCENYEAIVLVFCFILCVKVVKFLSWRFHRFIPKSIWIVAFSCLISCRFLFELNYVIVLCMALMYVHLFYDKI